MNQLIPYEKAFDCLAAGGLIAYPCEAVYGLGCNPFDKVAVERLLALKQRPVACGLILLVADWNQADALVRWEDAAWRDAVAATWPGPVTWVFPKSALVPAWISGDFDTVAIRMSAHPVAHALCTRGPLVSTSANLRGLEPARTVDALLTQFPQGLDAIVGGDIGGAQNPSAIRDVRTGAYLRQI